MRTGRADIGAAPGGPSARAAAACGAGGAYSVGGGRAERAALRSSSRGEVGEAGIVADEQSAVREHAAACWQREAARRGRSTWDGGEHLRGGRALRRRGRRRWPRARLEAARRGLGIVQRSGRRGQILPAQLAVGARAMRGTREAVMAAAIVVRRRRSEPPGGADRPGPWCRRGG